MERSWRLFNQNCVCGWNKKWKFFGKNKLEIKITNSTVLNKLQSYTRISALRPEGHCTSRFKRVMCVSCRPHVDVHKGEGGWLMWRGDGSKSWFLWMS